MAEIAPLSERDQAILEFEAIWYRKGGSKEEEIRQRFGLSATRYYQLLNIIIDTEAALAFDPVLVNRLIDARQKRTAQRASRRFSN